MRAFRLSAYLLSVTEHLSFSKKFQKEGGRSGRMVGVTDVTPDFVREVLGTEASDSEVAALIEWYAALSRGVAAFPAADLRAAEPALRSTPGPTR
jgi:hypothetical protein